MREYGCESQGGQDANGKNQKFVRLLHDTLTPFRPGSCGVVVHYHGPAAKAALTFPEDWSVRPTRELMEKLTQLVGQDGVRLIYAPRLES